MVGGAQCGGVCACGDLERWNRLAAAGYGTSSAAECQSAICRAVPWVGEMCAAGACAAQHVLHMLRAVRCGEFVVCKAAPLRVHHLAVPPRPS